MRAICIQPPLVQLNAPYPAVWYLDAWLRGRGIASCAVDHSIALARRVFSSEGLAVVFEAARERLSGMHHPDAETERRVQGYLDDEAAYLSCIDAMMGFLSGEDPAYAYRIAVGSGLPAGMRAEAVFGDGIGPDDARAFATATVNDLSDFIAYALDPSFGTVRYAERLARSASSYAEIASAADRSWTYERFYRPILSEAFSSLSPMDDERVLVALSVPFPGCLAGAIAAARAARAALGDRALIVAGGGYVSTELRFLTEPSVFDDFDYLAYDAGYGALASILDAESVWRSGEVVGAGRGAVATPSRRDRLFRVRYRDEVGAVVAAGFPPDEPCGGLATQAAQAAQASTTPGPSGPSKTERPEARAVAALSAYAMAEKAAIANIHPDYAGLEASSYLRIVDSPNPMHRLWNDTPWLKYRLAYGCYWARCAFCDTELDYIKRYQPSDLDALLEAADAASKRTGLYGLHFVDEALPVNLVRAFAARNALRRRPFTYWGNVRFDKAWSDEAVGFAAERGLVAVSGGIEIATERGLAIVGKGMSMEDLVRTLMAFKRSGVLVHAYLVYGFPGQPDQDIADSAEMVRVLLAEGLVDSAFWHKFVLTRHSAMYAAWERGGHPSLRPLEPVSGFALNDLRFQGEGGYDRWTAPLDAALAAWADEGRVDSPLAAFLPKGLARPRIDAFGIISRAGAS